MTRLPVRITVDGPMLLVDGAPRTALATITGEAMLWDPDTRAWRLAGRHLAAVQQWCADAGHPVELTHEAGPRRYVEPGRRRARGL